MKNNEHIGLTEESLTECITLIRTLTKRYGVDGGKPGQLIGLWEEEMNRTIFELSHGSNNQYRKANDRRKYISVFKARYLQSHDWEYPTDVSPIDAKCIDSVIEKLSERGFSVDEYLAWYFDVYLPENPKMAPETLSKSACSYCYAAFMCANTAKLQQRKESQGEEADMLKTIERAKILIRGATTTQIVEKTKEALINFRERRIILIELKHILDELERQAKNDADTSKRGQEHTNNV